MAPVRSAARVARGFERPVLAALTAAVLTTIVLAVAPSGGDQAAHLYQVQLWREHGWQLWDNLWYAGRYSQVNYSLLFYPLAATLGSATVVIGSTALAAAAFTTLIRRHWPSLAAGPSLAFAVLAPLAAVSGTFPFLLGLALALTALTQITQRRAGRATLLAAFTALAHPLALAFLLVVAAAIAASVPGWWRGGRERLLGVGLMAVAATQLVLARAFWSDGGRYPFDVKAALAIAGFCAIGLLATRGMPGGRHLRALFVVYGVVAAAAFVIPSPIGGNIERLVLLFGTPLLALPLAARGFRPRYLATAALLAVLSWQLVPIASGWKVAASARAQDEAFWYPALAFLSEHGDPDYRVQVVATADNWEAYHLARRGVPIARGWYRQDDFPENAALYERLTPHRYQAWMRRLGVRYVLLPDDPLDPSARSEAALLRAGSGLRQVADLGAWRIFELAYPTPIATPARHARMISVTPDAIRLRVDRPGRYRLRVSYTPYWEVARGAACVAPRRPWGTELRVARPGIIELRFGVELQTLVGAVLGDQAGCGPPQHGPIAPDALRVPADL